jgi:tetratricopeptide (TPR) repeat protein/predicted Ser/Thr protein kinase
MGNSETDGLDDALRVLRPAPDELALEQMRARLAVELFDDSTEPAKLGRFVLIDSIGLGGMGNVYSAFDPELEREVALKVLKPQLGDAGTRDLLLKEARSLAKLSHPNVVPVHEIVEVDGRVVLVMEYVSGTTVETWQSEEARMWPEIVDIYAQLGDGIAAAHELGIVHRDVKPQNAIIGADGRVRVVDFGLARLGAEIAAAHGSADELETVTMTSSHGVAGTPAYMSPEQFTGAEVGPASDQFSLCVSLYRALYNRRPFSGSTVDELRESVLGGDVRPPPRDRPVPRWLHAAVIRGLKRRSEDRHESVASLCAALRRDPRRRRRRIAAATGAITLLGLTAWSLMRDDARDPPCSTAPERLAEVWNDARESALSAALAAAGPYGRSIDGALIGDVDDYGAAFVALHGKSCMANQRGEESDELLDKRMGCLGNRLVALDGALAGLLEVDAASVKHAREVIADLPAVAYCGDTEAMIASRPPPQDPNLRAQVDALEKQLAQIDALENMKRLDAARERARALVADAETLDYPPLTAGANLAVGRALVLERHFRRAIEPLRRAEAIALEFGYNEIAVEAIARRLFAESLIGRPVAELHQQFALIEPLSRRLADRGFARALLLNNVGVAHMTAGNATRARRLFERAFAEIGSRESRPTELWAVDRNLAMLTRDPEARKSLASRAYREVSDQLGQGHLLSLEFGSSYAHYDPDPEAAHRMLEPICTRYAELHPDRPLEQVTCLSYLGFLETELGRPDQAAERFARAAQLGPSTWPSGEVRRRLSRAAWRAIDGQPPLAARHYREVLESLSAAPSEWWSLEYEAIARSGLAAAHLEIGDHEAAAKEAATAVERFEGLADTNANVEFEQRLAIARTTLARAHMRLARPAPAEPLFADAERWYRAVNPRAYRHRLEAIERWRAEVELTSSGRSGD